MHQSLRSSVFTQWQPTEHLAFHPNARIRGDTPQGSFEMTVVDFAFFVETQSTASDVGENPFIEMLSLEVHGQTAVARVRDHYMGNRYLDTLSFVKTGDRWSIYYKLFHIDGPAGD